MAEFVSVAYVVDASLALASEWNQVLAEYLLPLLHRLGEAYTNPQVRLGVVSYGPAETRPTPLLGKHFFTPLQHMLKELRERPEMMGLGLTSSGEPTGMAALEGLVAAIEFFDMYGDVLPNMTSHIIHIASAPPDGSDHPVWNIASNFDDVSWETLPGELKKRNIHYSNILLKPLARFSELYASAIAGSTQQPWFPVRPPHVLHLTGFPLKGAKHAPEATATTARNVEHKRTKAEAHSSPPQQPASSSPPLSHAPPPTATQQPTQSPTQPPPQPRPVMTTPPDPAHIQALIIKKKQEIQEYTDMKRKKEAEASTKDLGKLLMLYKVLVTQQGRMVQASQSQPVNVNNVGGSRPGSGSGPDGGSAGPNVMQASTSMPIASGSAAANGTTVQAETQPNRSAQPSQPPHPEQNPTIPPVAHIPPGQSSANALTINVPPPELPQSSPAMPNSQVTRTPGQAQSGYTRVWEGGIIWIESGGRQLHANVALNGPEMMRRIPWPKTLTLEPSSEYRAHTPVLQDWLKSHTGNYQVVLAQLHSPPGEPQQHEVVWQSIISSHRYPIVSFPDASGAPVQRLLFFPARHLQFGGAFFTSTGGVPPRPPLIIGGISVQSLPPPLVSLLLAMSPQQVSELEKLDTQAKQAKIYEYLQAYKQRQIMLRQAQQNRQGQASQSHLLGQPQGPVLGNANAGGMATPSTMFAQPAVQQQPSLPSQQRGPVPPNNLNTMIPMNPFINGLPPSMDQVLALGGSTPQGGLQGPNRVPSGLPNPMASLPNGMGVQGMHQRVPSGGGGMTMSGMGGVNFSPEMMQSFMQRRQDGPGGMGGMGGGMGGMGM